MLLITSKQRSWLTIQYWRSILFYLSVLCHFYEVNNSDIFLCYSNIDHFSSYWVVDCQLHFKQDNFLVNARVWFKYEIMCWFRLNLDFCDFVCHNFQFQICLTVPFFYCSCMLFLSLSGCCYEIYVKAAVREEARKQ